MRLNREYVKRRYHIKLKFCKLLISHIYYLQYKYYYTCYILYSYVYLSKMLLINNKLVLYDKSSVENITS